VRPQGRRAGAGVWSLSMMRDELRARVLLACLGTLVASASCALGPKNPAPGPADRAPAATQTFAYVATAGGAIEVFTLDAASGQLAAGTRASSGASASALAGLPFGTTLVALDDKAGAITAFEIAAGGNLRPIGRASTGGTRPGRTILDRSGKYVLVTNQASASVAVLALGPGPRLLAPDIFPAGAGAYGITLHPNNSVAFVANTKAGTLSQLAFNEGTGTLTTKTGAAIGLPWGSGPRQVGCHPNGRFVYVLNETNGTVSVHPFDDRMGTVTRLAFQVEPIAASEGGGKSHARELAVSVNGRNLYVLDDGEDRLVTLQIDQESGGLSLLTRAPSGGTGAIGLALDPTGGFLVVAHGGSRHLASFRLDPQTGAPTLVDSKRTGSPPTALTMVRPRGSR
jgi:6-phosphogluconolactonase